MNKYYHIWSSWVASVWEYVCIVSNLKGTVSKSKLKKNSIAVLLIYLFLISLILPDVVIVFVVPIPSVLVIPMDFYHGR